MDQDHTTKTRQDLVNQFSLDLLLRRLGTTVLRRKFKEIYAKLNGGKEWTDEPEAGAKFCQSKWGNGAHTNANTKQQEMMEGGNIQNWDLHCLQSVITCMVTEALRNAKQENKGSNWRAGGGTGVVQEKWVNWDREWKAQMWNIRKLANIRNFIAHMPSETLSQGEFEEKWGEAVVALKGLGAKQQEVDDILKMSQPAFNLLASGKKVQGQQQVLEKNPQMNSQKEDKKTLDELRAAISELQLHSRSLSQSQIEGQKEINDQVKGQLTNETADAVVVNKENELKAKSLTKRGNLAGTSGDWEEALEFYTRALDIPGISDRQRRIIYMNRCWIHLRVLQMPEFPFNVDFSKSPKFNENVRSQKASRREPKFLDEQFLKIDQQKWPEKLTEELREFHLTAGTADAESALQLSTDDQKPLKAFYRLAQFLQLKEDWNSALTYFDLALDKSDLDDYQLDFDRNACQLEVLNETDVEEFHWIPGKKNQTMAGLAVWQNPDSWRHFRDKAMNENDPEQKLYDKVIKAHFLAQGLPCEKQGQNKKTLEVTEQAFEEVVKLYEGAANSGFPSGLYNLGLLLQEGNGVHQKDFCRAVRLFKMAANFSIDDNTPFWMKEGVLEAQYRLGLCYEFGLGVGKDERKALHWYEMASLGDYGKASRKLGDIYSQGLLGVAKDDNMAVFCWEQATVQGQTRAMSSLALHCLQSPPVNWGKIRFALNHFSVAVEFNIVQGTPTMLANVLDRKQHFQSVLTTVLEEAIHPYSNSTDGDTCLSEEHEEREPEGLSWNLSAYAEHTLNTIHLLELVQTPEFQQKLETNSNWKREFIYLERLVRSSNSCVQGLAALQELNKLYREALIKDGRANMETEYPPDLRKISGVDQVTLTKEGQLVTLILNSFSNSVRTVGAAFYRDEPSQFLIHSIAKKMYNVQKPVQGSPTYEEAQNHVNAALLFSYTSNLKTPGHDGEEFLEDAQTALKSWEPIMGPISTIFTAAVLGSTGKFEKAADEVEKSLKRWADPRRFNLVCDLLFVQALCCKSAGLSRGVNSANRKKVKEAMAIFQKFLSICPKDEPKRADAHYQLGLCTLYLQKMKVKGQVKSTIAKDILAKVLPHFTQGEAAEQHLPWKDFPFPDKSPVKLRLHRKIRELEAFREKGQLDEEELAKVPNWNWNQSCVGRLVDPYFMLPISSFPLKLRGAMRVGVIKNFRKFFKAVRSFQWGIRASANHLSKVPFNEFDVFTASNIDGCFEIIEPILNCLPTIVSEEQPTVQVPQILLYTVVQDESGAVFNLQLHMNLRGDKDEQIRPFHVGARIIVSRPFLYLDGYGGIRLLVRDADQQIFHLSSKSKQRQQTNKEKQDLEVTRKCGFCFKVGEKLQRCSTCKTVYYCDKECQKFDWNELKHNLICPFLQQQTSFKTRGNKV